MFSSSRTPTSEPGTKRLLLVQAFQPSNGYGKLFATVVRLAEADKDLEDGGKIYNDGKEVSGYRNAHWTSSKKNALYIGTLVVTCQITLEDVPLRSYGNDYQFDSWGQKIDRRSAHAMSNTFTKMDKAMDKINEDEGYIRDGDYAAWCARVAAVLGIDTFLFSTVPMATNSQPLSDERFWKVVKRAHLGQEVEQLMLTAYGKK